MKIRERIKDSERKERERVEEEDSEEKGKKIEGIVEERR